MARPAAAQTVDFSAEIRGQQQRPFGCGGGGLIRHFAGAHLSGNYTGAVEG
ncbi:hypothetical protein ACFPJ1_17345 [Kribbella qitaiheensis]|uniref:hypothetical protein n=1 Tax=Kribbella qitaiheensis TaxID=1544730 RepID=UPI00362430F1